MNQDLKSSSKTIRVAIIGGGVAGLSAAFRIREELRAANQPHELVLYEQNERCGGATQSQQIDGYSLDLGPNGWLSSEPLTGRLVDQLGLTSELITANTAAGHRFIYTRNRLQKIPETPTKFLLSGLLRPWEKLRVVKEYFTPARSDDGDETIYDFGCRRLGRGFAETMLDPMVSGIFAGDIHQLSLPATFPKMRAMELNYGGLFRAMFAKQKEKKKAQADPGGSPTGPAGVLTTLQGGTGRLSSELASVMSDVIRKGNAVSALSRQSDQFVVSCDGDHQQYDSVVMAVPAYQAAEIVKDLTPEISQTLQKISFANVAVVSHAYDRKTLPRELNGFGHLIPRRDGIRALGCLWTSCIFPNQAPTSKVLLRTIFGGSHDPEILSLSDSELIETVVESTATTLGIRTNPLQTWIFRHPQGIAQYTLGHRERVQQIEQFCEQLPGLVFVGASYRGVALNRCIRDAYTIAPRVLLPWGINAPSLSEKPPN
ncbi:MAG: protoporphyrinogen oxidase [Planctomycetaceae bacterium]|nr:protoporphyrinogen oxidase [Planctomycetaceae bacterium]